jgi:hypothetical protein
MTDTPDEALRGLVAELKRLAPGCSGWVREPMEKAAAAILALQERLKAAEADADALAGAGRFVNDYLECERFYERSGCGERLRAALAAHEGRKK